MGKAQQVKRTWPGLPLGSRAARLLWWASERHQPRLVGMQRQPVLGETLPEHLQHPTRVSLMGKADDEIVCVADEKGTSLQEWFHLLLEPHVQHVVQIDVGQQRGDDPTLRGTRLRNREAPILEHTRIEPLPD